MVYLLCLLSIIFSGYLDVEHDEDRADDADAVAQSVGELHR